MPGSGGGVAAAVGSKSKCPDYIATINGYTGVVLQLTSTADHKAISIGPILKSSGDGSTFVIYSTVSPNCSLYISSLKDIASGRKDLVSFSHCSIFIPPSRPINTLCLSPLLSHTQRGSLNVSSQTLFLFFHFFSSQVRTILTNISRGIDEVVVADITADGMEDLIVSLDNSSSGGDANGGGRQVVALSGTDLALLWTHLLADATSLKYNNKKRSLLILSTQKRRLYGFSLHCYIHLAECKRWPI